MLASRIKDMYFFWHMLHTWMCIKHSLYRKNPAALARLSITLKIKVHFASLQTNRSWGEKRKPTTQKGKMSKKGKTEFILNFLPCRTKKQGTSIQKHLIQTK